VADVITRKNPHRAAYALPTLFTAGNIFLGYLSIVRTIQGAIMYSSNPDAAILHFEVAAKTIGFSFILDGLDGRIARMTNTTSEFGKELDSLADIISFGIAPAILAYVWGVQFVTDSGGSIPIDQLQRAGKFLSFLFLACGAARLARFNIQKPSTAVGSQDKKYFVGLAIPAGAGVVASVVYASGSAPLTNPYWSMAWLGLVATVSFLMISTLRYWSFKELNMVRPRSPIVLVGMCALIFGIWNWSQPVLLIMSVTYMMSAIVVRIGAVIRRIFRPTPRPETQIG
jgi:CDP-diacylglycerol--serine O-phosphatidyltransferase